MTAVNQEEMRVAWIGVAWIGAWTVEVMKSGWLWVDFEEITE